MSSSESEHRETTADFSQRVSPDDIEKLVGLQLSVTGPPSPGPSRLNRLKSFWKSTAATAQALSLHLAAVDDAELAAKLRPFERNFSMLRGWLQVLDFGVKSVGLTLLLGWVSGSGISADIIVMAVVLAAFLVTADHMTFVRAPLVETGLRVLADAGLKIELPSLNRRSVRRAKTLRVAVSCLTGVLLAFAIGLNVDHAAIVQQQQRDWLADNHANYQQAVGDFGMKEKDLEDAYKHALTQSKKRLSAYRRKQNQAELARLQGAIQAHKSGRAQDMNHWLAGQPDSIPKDDSVLGESKAFVEVLWANPLAALPVLGIDALALALDLMTAMLSLVYIPSLYAAETLRRQLEAIVQTARAAAANLKPIGDRPTNEQPPRHDASEPRKNVTSPPDDPDPPEHPPASPAAGAAAPPQPPRPPISTANGAAMPRRGPGRPRKDKSPPPTGQAA